VLAKARQQREVRYMQQQITAYLNTKDLFWLTTDAVELVETDDGTASIGIDLSAAKTVIITPEPTGDRYAVIVNSFSYGVLKLLTHATPDEVLHYFKTKLVP
jgi:hypothetical protein